MTTKQTDITDIASWQQLDIALGILRVNDAEIAGDSARYDKRIQAVQAEKQEVVQPKLDKRKRIEALVEDFVKTNRKTLGAKPTVKSRKLVHGIVGFRAGKKKVTFVTSSGAAMKLLRVRDHLDCLKVKESINRAKVAELPESEQRLCGIVVGTGPELFFYKLNESDPIEYPDVIVEQEAS